MLSFAPTVDRLTRFGLASHDLRDSFLGEEGLTCEPLCKCQRKGLVGKFGRGGGGEEGGCAKTPCTGNLSFIAFGQRTH